MGFAPTTEGQTTAGTLTLFEQNKVVLADSNVIVNGFEGAIGGHFFVGIDPTSHRDYVAFSGLKTPT